MEDKSKGKSQKEKNVANVNALTEVPSTGGDLEGAGFGADKNINNTTHEYILADTEEKIVALVKELLQQTEICFDTETTGIDANDAELVGMSFSYKPHEAYYIPCPADQTATKKILEQFAPLFNATNITGLELFEVPPNISAIMFVPATVPSLIHDSFPWTPSLAPKYTLSLIAYSTSGEG